MKKHVTTFISILFCLLIYSQNKQGKVIYEFDVNLEDYLDNYAYKAELIFDTEQTHFVYNSIQLEGKSSVDFDTEIKHKENHFASVRRIFENNGLIVHHDLSTKRIISKVLLANKYLVLVKQDSIKFNWNITNTQKKIGEYKAYKAYTDYMGRVYEAWFTYEIPLPIGPWKFSGLPGLILEVKDEYNQIIINFKKLVYPIKKARVFTKPTGGEEMKLEEFLEENYRLYLSQIETAKAVMAARNIKVNNTFKPLPYYSIEFLPKQEFLLEELFNCEDSQDKK
ncbi:GLPGLI family protein [Mangrovimonas cancribranchiae]|uniref:GLPGLI family protein n=1 Tax=Mangrovimonas cancribranchiae TaxID=3080055 RepID=A0AAU6P1V6_9FLAO